MKQTSGKIGFVMALASVSLSACHNEPILEAGSKRQSSLASSNAEGQDVGTTDEAPYDVNEVVDPNANVVNIKYNVSAAALGIKVCTGRAQFKLRANVEADGRLFELPYAKIKCLGGLLGTFDLREALGGLAGQEKDYTGVTVTGNVIRLKGFAQTVYQEPWRPFLPAFLSSKPEDLRNLNVSQDLVVKDANTLKTYDGKVSLKTMNFGVSYDPPGMPGVTLRNTMRVTSESKGFKGMEKLQAMIFDRMEMVISLSPFSIPTMVVETKMKDVLKAAQNMPDAPKVDGLTSLFIGWVKMKITMEMFDQQGLRKFLEQERAMEQSGTTDE